MVAKPWGGRRLEAVLRKDLPAGAQIGESWELCDLPYASSIVVGGKWAGRSLQDLLLGDAPGLLGEVEPIEGRFPLLLKFLDTAQPLSVQVHPRPEADDPLGLAPDIKHEAWYVVHAEPGAEVFIGLKPGVAPADLPRAKSRQQVLSMLQAHPARPGDCFYVPSGVIHALGAGLVVAEVQTPSDVTYRLYDWDRIDEHGRARELHIPQALANSRSEVRQDEIVHLRREIRTQSILQRTRLCACARFTLDALRLPNAAEILLAAGPPDTCRAWMTLRGEGMLTAAGETAPFRAGDTLLFPAELSEMRVQTHMPTTVLEVAPVVRR